MPNEAAKKFKLVLLVEDDEPIIRAIKHSFEDQNLELVLAHDGEEGFAKAEETRPDLILLDIIMPKMDGITMLRELRKTVWGKKIPVIILTNLSSPIQEEAAEGLDVADYLIKTDWKLEDIVEKVKTYLKI